MEEAPTQISVQKNEKHLQNTKKKYNLSPFLIDFTAGFAGGTALVYSSQPFDTCKTKLQSFPKQYNNSLITCFKQTYKNEGIFRGLYRGTTPNIAVNALENGILFLSYEKLKKIYKPETTTHFALCGSVAAFISSFALCPTELIKVRLQASHELKTKNESLWQLLKKINKEKGRFFQGLTSTWAREVPGYFFFFYGKECVREAARDLLGISVLITEKHTI